MRLLLVRHAETDHNRGGLVQGRADPPLNATGQAQARALAAVLAREPIARIYSSPLRRAVETAAAIAGAHGLPVELEPALAEMDVGELDGLSAAGLRERYPDVLRAWAAGEAGSLRLPGGESLQEVQDRAWAFVEELGARFADEMIACVTHSFVALSILCRALELPVGEFRRLRQSVAGVSTLDVRRDRRQIVRLNDTCHLPPNSDPRFGG